VGSRRPRRPTTTRSRGRVRLTWTMSKPGARSRARIALQRRSRTPAA
jgi:hypothetical protein